MSPGNKKITLALCLAALLQAGCSTGPLTPLEGPLQAPERFKGGDPNARQVQAKWWEAYNDATLKWRPRSRTTPTWAWCMRGCAPRASR